VISYLMKNLLNMGVLLWCCHFVIKSEDTITILEVFTPMFKPLDDLLYIKMVHYPSCNLCSFSFSLLINVVPTVIIKLFFIFAPTVAT
jgi:hypothetical protein